MSEAEMGEPMRRSLIDAQQKLDRIGALVRQADLQPGHRLEVQRLANDLTATIQGWITTGNVRVKCPKCGHEFDI